MMMSYLGTLKSWLYRPILRIFGPTVFAVRLPVVLAGAFTVWLFYLLLRRISGERAALVGAALLATDSMFLLTTCFDWGPVALQHLLIVGGLLLLLRFYQQGSTWSLFSAFLLWGLAFWDKALAVWILSGIGLAGIAIFPRQIFRVTRIWRIAMAVVAFFLGSLPLWVYDLNQNYETFHGNAVLDTSDLHNKTMLLLNTARGQAMFGWLVDEDVQAVHPHPPHGLFQKASAALSRLAGRPRNSLMLCAFVVALLLTPLARGGELRAILFGLVAMVVAWVQMAVTAHAGGSVHHVILLWPFPQLVIALSFVAAVRRLGRGALPALAAVTVLAAASNLLVLNQYYAQAVRDGGAVNWTDAVFPLSNYMKGVSASNVFCVDWGLLDTLRLLSHGTIPLRVGNDPVSKPELSAEETNDVKGWVSDPGSVFVAHTPEFEFFQGVNAKLAQMAAGWGYRKDMLTVISDSYGRPTFEVYRFKASPVTAAVLPTARP
ncbi:MAG TPA: glycosyltransferase family 39 protein [Bryobacteraceae bacterium]|nr:glycosyltransferase family 39 protein [Bryobacteraceae bacterium]